MEFTAQNPRRLPRTMLAFYLLLGAAPLFSAPLRFVAGAGSRLYLTGDSTLHKYRSVSQGFVAIGDLETRSGDTAEMRKAIFNGKMSEFVLEVPVIRLKSEREGLDENLQKALRAAEHPGITFKMASYEAYSAGEDTQILVKAKGELRVAGKSREVVITGKVELGDNSFTLTGSKELLMSDFDVRPPVLFLGTVKTDDRIVVHFHLKMIPAKK